MPPNAAARYLLLLTAVAVSGAAAIWPSLPCAREMAANATLWSLADYLEAIGADPIWVERIDEPGRALDDLAKGELADFLRPSLSTGHPIDPLPV